MQTKKIAAILIEYDGKFDFIPMTSIVRVEFSDRPFSGMASVSEPTELPDSGYIKLTVLGVTHPLESIIFRGESAKIITAAIQRMNSLPTLMVFGHDIVERYIVR